MTARRWTAGAAFVALAGCAGPGGHDGHGNHAAMAPDARVAVRFPEPLKSHTLANMRDHLLVIQRVQESMARGEFASAGKLAEERLGISSLALHGAHDVAKHMPKGMQDAGTAMHKSASRFAIAAENASATGDVKPALAALAEVTAQCVACHAAYRLE